MSILKFNKYYISTANYLSHKNTQKKFMLQDYVNQQIALIKLNYLQLIGKQSNNIITLYLRFPISSAQISKYFDPQNNLYRSIQTKILSPKFIKVQLKPKNILTYNITTKHYAKYSFNQFYSASTFQFHSRELFQLNRINKNSLVIVKNLPYYMTMQSMVRLANVFGSYESLVYPQIKIFSRFKGHGFIEYNDFLSSHSFCNLLDGSKFCKKILNCHISNANDILIKSEERNKRSQKQNIEIFLKKFNFEEILSEGLEEQELISKQEDLQDVEFEKNLD